MIFSSALRCSLLSALLAGAWLAVPSCADANPAGSTFPSKQAPDWFRAYPPEQFRQLDTARQPIEPTNLREHLLAAAIFQETNQRRADLGLPAFLPDEKASAAARLHSGWMARTQTLSHEEPSVQGPPVTARERLVRQGIRPHATAENIAYNFRLDLLPGKPFYPRLENGRRVYSYRPGGVPLPARTYAGFARVIVSQWMRSPLHRAHIVNPDLRFLGVGTALARRPGHPETIYATQDFYTSHSSSSEAVANPAEVSLQPGRF